MTPAANSSDQVSKSADSQSTDDDSNESVEQVFKFGNTLFYKVHKNTQFKRFLY